MFAGVCVEIPGDSLLTENLIATDPSPESCGLITVERSKLLFRKLWDRGKPPEFGAMALGKVEVSSASKMVYS